MVNLLSTIICLYLYHDLYSLYYTMVTRVYIRLSPPQECVLLESRGYVYLMYLGN